MCSSATAGVWLKSGVKRVHSIRRLVTSIMIATFVDFFRFIINIVVGNFLFVVCNIFVLIRLLVARSHCRDSCACMHRSCSGCNMPFPSSMREMSLPAEVNEISVKTLFGRRS